MKNHLYLFQRLRPFCLLLYFLALMPASVWGQSLSLRYEDLPSLIAEKNGAVQASTLSVDSARQGQDHLKRSFLPQVQINGGVGHFKTGDYSLKTQPYGGAEVDLNLYRGGRDKLEETLRIEQTRLSESKRDKTLREELKAVRLLYWELVYQREKVQSFGEIAGLSQSARQAAQLRMQRGLSTDTDGLVIDLFRQQVQEEIESARHEIKLLQMAIATQLGLDPSIQFETDVRIQPVFSQPAHQDMAAHPEISILNLESKINQTEAKRLQRYWLPSVDLYGKSYLYTLQDREFLKTQDRLDHGVGIQIHSTLFDGLNSQREAQSKLLQATAQARMARHQSSVLKNEEELAKEELEHIRILIENSKQYTSQWKKIFKKTLEEYDVGLRSTQETLSAIERLLHFKKNEIERKLEYQKIQVKLAALRGK